VLIILAFGPANGGLATLAAVAGDHPKQVGSAACINKKRQGFDREVVAAIEAGIRCHVEQSEYMILESSFLTVPFSAPLL
jgi:hypothetical protein